MEMTHHTDKIWTIDGFLAVEACNELIERSERIGYQEADVSLTSGAQMMKNIRNNYRALYADDLLAKKFWDQLKAFCPEELEENYATGLNEQFRFYKYESGQRFKRHIDGRFKRNEQEESRITFMIYLNEGFEGGETRFDGVVIKPKTGTALCFIHEIKHEGSPVKVGIKYVLRSDVMYRKK